MSKLFTPFELVGVEVGKGWWPLVEPILNRIQELNDAGAHIEVDQVKEKYGELCIYVGGDVPDDLYEMIREAEKKSIHICEKCGKPGNRFVSKFNWVYTLCPDCTREKEKEIDDIIAESKRK